MQNLSQPGGKGLLLFRKLSDALVTVVTLVLLTISGDTVEDDSLKRTNNINKLKNIVLFHIEINMVASVAFIHLQLSSFFVFKIDF